MIKVLILFEKTSVKKVVITVEDTSTKDYNEKNEKSRKEQELSFVRQGRKENKTWREIYDKGRTQRFFTNYSSSKSLTAAYYKKV